MRFADHFSGHAAAYAQSRPDYPGALFAWLARQCEGRRLAWDVGCGNGQATVALAWHFERVIGTEPSAAQLVAALPHPRVEYRNEAAERPSLDAGSADLVVVAQALHWFEQQPFHAGVARVLRPGGVFAAISYGLSEVDEAVDGVFARLYSALDPWWPAERAHVENGYRDLPFPYQALSGVPAFAMQLQWTLPQYLAYLRTWSASQRYAKDTGRDSVAEHAEEFAHAWGDPQLPREVRWPLTLRAGRHATANQDAPL
jgi:SAM-dependent methyltransferase